MSNTIKAISTIFFLLAFITSSKAQVGIGTNTPHSSAALDINSTSKTLLIPRLTTAQRDGIASATDGMLIFNRTTGKFQGYAISTFTNIASSTVGLTDTYVSLDNYPAQTFQVSEATSNCDISFWVDKFYNSFVSGEITIELRQGTPGGSNTLLSTQNMTINSLGQKTIYIRNISLSTGTTYHFLLKPKAAYAAGWLGVSRSGGAGGHNGGKVYYNERVNNIDDWITPDVDDLKFEITKVILAWADLN